ncbi:MAG: DUF4058 family protein [Planctomycetaceae bacterium]
MPAHDWTRVEAGIFHDFHVAWLPELRKALNGGLLPDGYYALAEQHYGRPIADLLTLHASPGETPFELLPPLADTGGTAVAEAPPQVQRRQTIEPAALSRRRSLAIRHVSGHRLIALLEIVSPANKDRARHVEEFTDKCVAALESGIHLLFVDLFSPGLHDPHRLHEIIRHEIEEFDDPDDVPADQPLTLASYAAGPCVEAYLEHLAVGSQLPEMPLFLQTDRYVNTPLEATYQAAWEGMPAYWRGVVEEKR